MRHPFPNTRSAGRPAVHWPAAILAAAVLATLPAPTLVAEDIEARSRPMFREAEEMRVGSGDFMSLTACQYFDSEGNRKLAYNCAFPGPEIHVKPGQKLEVLVSNELEHLTVDDLESFQPQVVGGTDSDAVKEFISKQSSITNFHTHGFHVSPQGRSDNVLLKINKGKHNKYTYDLPGYHAPGTHWYHAHLHGSTSVQVQGGMAGALIVDPSRPEEGLNPPGYSVIERVMVLQFGSGDAIDPAARARAKAGALGRAAAGEEASGESQSLIDVGSLQELRNLVNRMDDDEIQDLLGSLQDLRMELPPLTVNGLENPVARVRQGRQVQRLRLINAGSRRSDYKTLWVEGHTMYVAAFDGVNLTELPRDSSGQFIAYDEENPLQLAPGNRADVYFLPESTGSFALMMSGEIGLNDQGGAARPAAAGEEDPGKNRRIRFERQLMTFEVSGEPPSAAAMKAGVGVDLEAFLVALDKHLKELQKTEPYATGYLRPFTATDYIPRKMKFDIENEGEKNRSFTINDRDYNKMVDGKMQGSFDYLGRVQGDGGRGPEGQTPWPLRSGTEEEWTIVNESSVRHPYHIHVSPFWVTGIREEMCVGAGAVVPCEQNPNDIDQCDCPDGMQAEVKDLRTYFPDDPRLDRWQDTVNLPAKGGSVTFRHRVSQFDGLYVVHCHILQHEDRGMMINILTVPNQDRNPQAFFEKMRGYNDIINDQINNY